MMRDRRLLARVQRRAGFGEAGPNVNRAKGSLGCRCLRYGAERLRGVLLRVQSVEDGRYGVAEVAAGRRQVVLNG